MNSPRKYTDSAEKIPAREKVWNRNYRPEDREDKEESSGQVQQARPALHYWYWELIDQLSVEGLSRTLWDVE